jgi:hypothetical protein
MAWAVITEADVLTVLSYAELTNFRSISLAGGQADPVSPTIQTVTDMVRGKIEAAATNTLGATGVPARLKATALDIIAVRLGLRVGKAPTDARKALYDDAMKLLEDVADGKFSVEEPATATNETVGLVAPSISTEREYEYDRDSQLGL